ncbi:hypothetical protein FPRO05_10583 [Fusarium proliferatum]|uniref:Uncharacterized protein n=1 Tax=Gibberella intermedia TaxID=948311 RepID=A0A365NCK3_GIBIN|nr:hypothetical protein FPRO05_10583 [Fusarium proliferatum]
MFSPSPQTLGIVVAVFILATLLIRRALLPKPIPGIVYREANAKKILGNAWELLQWKKKHGEMFGYLANLAVELNEPVFQIFVHPLGKPWVIVADNREAFDILSRRTPKEFDRSRFLRSLFMPLVPEFHFHMPTGDRWKAHRKLVADTMSPAFLGGVAGPQMWKSTMKLIDLWRVKERLAKGRPFSVSTDIRKAAFEIIWAATFGFDSGSTNAQTELLETLPEFTNLGDMDHEVEFPVAPDPPVFKAGLALNDAMNIGVQSLVPGLHLWLAYNLMPSLRAARNLKEAVIQDEIKKAINKFSNQTDLNWEDQGNLKRHMKSAVDIVIAREIDSARKEGRTPELMSRTVQDELFSFMLAGNEIFTLTAWTLKFLTTHQNVQKKVRDELREECSAAVERGDAPTVSEIMSARLPYFEAMIEESTRCGSVTQTNIRTTMQEVNILGHMVPKHTEILMLNNGPGSFMPPLSVDEEKRSESSKGTAGKIGQWNVKGMRDFDPERWLVKDEEGRLTFNPNAGPRHSFGAGPRACFGPGPRLKIIMALGLGKLKTLGLSVLIFAILVAGFDKTDDKKHGFQLQITGARILGLLIVIFVVSNFKSMPFVWTFRVLYTISYHTVLRKSPQLGPKALFKPIIATTSTSLLEVDYYLHKSNSTYFADLDVGRAHLIAYLFRHGFHRLSNNTKLGIVLDPKTGTPMGGRLGINLGAVETCFRREITAFKQVEMWSYVLTWDRKWLYIVTHFVPKGTALPAEWLDPRFARTATRPLLKDSANLSKKIYATALSKYVFKLKRLTVPPSTVLEEAGLLPTRPGGWTIGEQGLETAEQDVTDIGVRKSGEWDWRRVESQRRRGIELISKPNHLDLIHDGFDGGSDGAIGRFSPG